MRERAREEKLEWKEKADLTSGAKIILVSQKWPCKKKKKKCKGPSCSNEGPEAYALFSVMVNSPVNHPAPQLYPLAWFITRLGSSKS